MPNTSQGFPPLAPQQNQRSLAAENHPGDSCEPSHDRLEDAATGRLPGSMRVLLNQRTLALSATGHFRGPQRVERELLYIVPSDAGQETLTPEEFATLVLARTTIRT